MAACCSHDVVVRRHWLALEMYSETRQPICSAPPHNIVSCTRSPKLQHQHSETYLTTRVFVVALVQHETNGRQPLAASGVSRVVEVVSVNSWASAVCIEQKERNSEALGKVRECTVHGSTQ